MDDVAQILGVHQDESALPPAPPAPSRAVKLQGLSREVADLIGTSAHGELPTSVPASGYIPDKDRRTAAVVKVGNKWVSSAKPARKWVWSPFSSSSRTDGLLLHHWVRGNVEYPDYPYARFDIHLDPVTYSSDEDYHRYLEDPNWTKSETDQLLLLAKQFELRWPVIYDRWLEIYRYNSGKEGDNNNAPNHRKIEDLQHRYYSVAAILMQGRISHEAATEAQTLVQQTSAAAAAAASAADPEESKRTTDALLIETAAARALAASDPTHQPLIHNIGTGTTNKVAFDLNYERDRRSHMESLWNRTKEEELEEAELRKELKEVEVQLRKMKKAGAHIMAAGDAKGKPATGPSSIVPSTASSRNPSREATPLPEGSGPGDSAAVASMVDKAFATTAPVPVAGTPYLQSARLIPPVTGGPGGINKTLRTRMDAVLDELHIPEKPIATKRACDLYDSVRRDILTLLILQKTALEKEGLLASKRLKLAKRGGNVRVVDEETLLGIAPAQPPAPSQSSSGRGSVKARKTGAGSTGKSKSAPKSKTSDATGPSNKSDAAKKDIVAPGGMKQAPASSTVGGKQVPGGKQARKGSTASKRKRKAVDSGKASAPAATAAAAATAALTTGTAPAGGVVSARAAAPANSSTAPPPTANLESKQPGKKRAKKS